jgi:hypothetical protein
MTVIIIWCHGDPTMVQVPNLLSVTASPARYIIRRATSTSTKDVTSRFERDVERTL